METKEVQDRERAPQRSESPGSGQIDRLCPIRVDHAPVPAEPLSASASVSPDRGPAGSLRILGILAASASVACGVDTTTQPPPATFENVVGIFEARGCATPSCHAGPAYQGELDLTADGAWSGLVNVPSANAAANFMGQLRVRPLEAENSFLYVKIAHSSLDESLGAPMPPDDEPLSGDDLDLIRRWIEAGAPR